MHIDPDYSAAYVILQDRRRSRGARLHVHDRPRQRSLRGGDRGVPASRRRGDAERESPRTSADSGGGSPSDSQLRWLGPEKGVIHLALAAIVNAVWDLYAKVERKPVWKLLADMTPKQLVVVHRLPLHHRRAHAGRGARDARPTGANEGRPRGVSCCRSGYPAYTTSVGWMGYSDDKIRAACREALAEGWTHFKVKVGADPADDARRVGLVREAIGPTRTLMVDANQRWDVDEAIARMQELARFNPLWIEEPTSPDDVLGHAAIAQAVRRSASRPASTAPTASSSSSCCRRARSASARSTAAGSAA